jgi:ABC-2 type transport system ATP-binding protein
MANHKPIIRVEKISKRFKNKVILHDLSMSVETGEIFGIMGPNGSGKTALINTLLGLMAPDSGTIEIFGRDLAQNLSFIRNQINAASTYYRLQDEISIWDNLLTYARLYGIHHPDKKIRTLLKMLDLEVFVKQDRKISTLSSGENTRLIFCKALLNSPKILFLDEPTASLDPISATHVREIISKAHRELSTTIVMASHDLDEITSLCTRVCFLKAGTITTVTTGAKAKTLVHLYQK